MCNPFAEPGPGPRVTNRIRLEPRRPQSDREALKNKPELSPDQAGTYVWPIPKPFHIVSGRFGTYFYRMFTPDRNWPVQQMQISRVRACSLADLAARDLGACSPQPCRLNPERLPETVHEIIWVCLFKMT